MCFEGIILGMVHISVESSTEFMFIIESWEQNGMISTSFGLYMKQILTSMWEASQDIFLHFQLYFWHCASFCIQFFVPSKKSMWSTSYSSYFKLFAHQPGTVYTTIPDSSRSQQWKTGPWKISWTGCSHCTSLRKQKEKETNLFAPAACCCISQDDCSCKEQIGPVLPRKLLFSRNAYTAALYSLEWGGGLVDWCVCAHACVWYLYHSAGRKGVKPFLPFNFSN